TAWVGVLCGLFAWWFLQRKKKGLRSRKRMLWSFAAVGIVTAAVVAAVFSGGLDRKVLTESPKSLQYRFEYWSGTLSVLAERPLFGTGPGNFRSHYLKHKLPESSEEISDPHNFLLDAWVSGGVVALAGLLLFLVLGLSACRCAVRQERDRSEEEPGERSTAGTSGSWMWIAGVLGSFMLVLAVDQLLVARYPSELSLLLGVCAALLAVTAGTFIPGRLSAACLCAAWVTLLVHLLGAGGMEMPAVVQLLLILPILASRLATPAPASETTKDDVPDAQPTRLAVAVIFSTAAITLFYVCLSTATFPVQLCQWNLAGGRGVLRDMAEQQRFFSKAVLSDPLNPEPQELLADLAFRRWQRQPFDRGWFEVAVKHQKKAIDLNPNNSRGFRVLGERYAVMFVLMVNDADAEKAVAAFEESLARYPHHSLTVAHLSNLMSRMKSRQQDAKTMARRALKLDQINLKRGHRDKLLQKNIRESLEAILH
ncbi:MAG: O-antigen ligase family protein, partial [Planctomycetes bacterium]|nr:O-antigen ligase family protein [Planctomycetota bacterium]